MEAASQPSFHRLRRQRARERELEQLRPLGEAYLLRRYGHTLSRADAEDAVADVLIRLHRKIEVGEPPRNLRATFFTSVRNAAIDQLRSRTAKPTAPLELVAEAPAEQPTPIEAAETRETSIRLQEALGRMRPNYKEAILLRFGVGLTVPEIAERLQISLPAAKKLVLRATAQVRKRLAAIDDQEFCPEMRELARHSLFEKEAAGLASKSEQQILRAHFQHCGSCKSFLSELQCGLNELGGVGFVAGTTGLGFHHGVGEQLGSWLGHAGEAAQSAGARLRLSALKLTGAFGPSDAASAGVLSSTAQKVAAVCGAATATTATCLATGIVGSGVGATGLDHSTPDSEKAPAAIVKPLDEEPMPPVIPTPEAESPPPPTAESQPHSAPESTSVQPEPSEATPSPEPAAEEFGFESSAPPPAEAPSAPAPETASPPSAAPAPSGGGGRSGGSESFGFSG